MTKKTTKKSNVQRVGKAKTTAKAKPIRYVAVKKKSAKTATKKSGKKPTSKTARKYKPIPEPVEIGRWVTSDGYPIMIIRSNEEFW